MRERVAQHVLEWRLHALEQVAVHFTVRAVDLELRALADFVRGLAPGSRGVMDMHLNAAGRPSMAFAAPVFGLQLDPGAASQAGYVLGVKEVSDELFPLLRQPGETAASARETERANQDLREDSFSDDANAQLLDPF